MMIYSMRKSKFMMSQDFWMGAKFGKGNLAQRISIIKKVREIGKGIRDANSKK